MIGERIPRREDPRLVTGRGCYTDDVSTLRALHLGIVRSAHAHAAVVSVDTEAARACPGVVAVLSATDLPELEAALPPRFAPGAVVKPFQQSAFADKCVRFVGEPIAVVVATDPYAAADGVERVVVEYEPLPALTTTDDALAADASPIHEAWGDNVGASHAIETGELVRARAASAVIVSRRIVFNRLAAVAIEPRAVVARWDPAGQALEMWATTQLPWHLREYVARVLGIAEERVRIVAPDVGGAFGSKGLVFAEYVIAATLARRLGQPVRWVDTRMQTFVSTNHGGDQIHEASLGARADGTFTFLEDDFVLDAGAYVRTGAIAPNNTAVHLMGVYRFDAFRCRFRMCVTHKVANTPYRGAGRAEAVFVLERLIDVVARELDMDAAEIRRRNLLRPDELPSDRGISYRDGVPVVYDSGDYPALLETALARADYAGFRARQRAARCEGRLIGIGIATYNEGTGIGPEERATVIVGDDGGVTVHVGSPSQGQSHATTLAQVCAARLGVPVDHVSVADGDTARFGYSWGTYASRVCVVVGSAVERAAALVRDKAAKLAAARLECDAQDVIVADGEAYVHGVRARAVTLAELSTLADAPEGVAILGEPGLQATGEFEPPSVTWSPGAHVATVEVDRDTGAVTILGYSAVHDVGREINPAVVEGQVHGGIAQGVGTALSEQIVYDETGQLVTGSLMDYAVPRAADVPTVSVDRMETPSPRNPLGVKGAGEGSAAAPAAAIANAICDALAEYGAELNEVPVRAERIARLMRKVENHGGRAS
jgi:aerobic carbon-monoxide dehydrogenase large subunit